MRLKKVLDDIEKAENKILELQEHVKRLHVQRKQMEDIEIVKSLRSIKMDSRQLLILLDGIQKGTVTMQFEKEDLKTEPEETQVVEGEKQDDEE